MSSRVFKATAACVQFFCIGHIFQEYVGSFVLCVGPSMEPSIYENDILLVEKRSVFKNTLKKGDVVIVRSPKDPQILLCKRLTALSGDRVSGIFSSKTIPRGHVWIEGDNSKISSDSRHFGPIPYGLIESRAFYKIWPLHDKGYINK